MPIWTPVDPAPPEPARVPGWWAEVTIIPTGIPSAEAFGTPSFASTQSVFVSGISSAEAFGTPALSYRQIVGPTGIASLEAFGGSSVTPGATQLLPQGIPSAQAFGTPTVTRGATFIFVAGIASGEAFGSPTVTRGSVNVAPTGIPSAEAFGTPSVSAVVSPAGIASEESFGVPSVGLGINAVGIPSAEAFGSPSIQGGAQNIGPTGIPSGEAFGGSALNPGAVNITVQGIGTSEAFGTPTVGRGAVTVTPTGIASAEAFGTAKTTMTVTPTGIVSQEAFGAAGVKGQNYISPTGIPSAEAFGNPTVIPPTAVGIPTVLIVGLNYSTTTSIPIPPHEAGDEIWIFAYRNGSNTAITVPGGSGNTPAWVSAAGGTGTNTNSSRLGRATATANNHTSGTWSGATEMLVIVTRGQATTALGGVAEGGSTSQTLAAAPAVTLTDTTGYSLLMHLMGRRPTITAWGNAFAGYTREIAVASSSGIALVTKNVTTSDGAVSIPITSTTSVGYRGITAEVRCRTTNPILLPTVSVDFDNATTGNGTAFGTASWSHTAAAGAYVMVTISNVTSPVSYCRYDGVDMTLLSSSNRCSVYGIYDLTGGTKTITAALTGSNYIGAAAASYLNVATATPNGTSVSSGTTVMTQTASTVPLGSLTMQTFARYNNFSGDGAVGGRQRIQASNQSFSFISIADAPVPMVFSTTNVSSHADDGGVNILLAP